MIVSRWPQKWTFGLTIAAGCLAAQGQSTYTWTGTVSTSYNNGGNWDLGSVPVFGSLLFIDDPDPNDTCIVDTTFNITIDELTLEGVSPTRMTLHVRDKTFTVTNRFFDFYDYGMIKAEKNFTVTGGAVTNMHGDIWVEILDTTPATVVYFQGSTTVDADGTTTLNINDHTDGVFKMDDLFVNADGAGNKTLAIDGSGSTLTVLESLQVGGSTSANY